MGGAAIVCRLGRTWTAGPAKSFRARPCGPGVGRQIPRMRVLVAGFNTGGYDQFFATHYTAGRRPLKKGDVIASSFRLVMSADGK